VTSATAWEEEDSTANSAVSQYFDLRADTSLGGFRLDLEGYGRVTGLEEELEPGDTHPNRFYHLTLAVTGAEGRSSVTMGRQFIPSITGPVMLDGIHVRAGTGSLAFKARWGYSSDVDGNGEEDHHILGAALDYNLKKGMHFTLDYGRTYDDSLLTELLAAEWTYSWHRFTRAYILFNWDLMSRTLHESLIGTKLFFSDKFTMILELSQNVPAFDSDSIYSVFAVDSAHTRSFSLLFTPTPTTRYVWDYAVESYQGEGGGRQYGVNGHWSPGEWKISAGLLQHKGFGGELTEITADLSKRVFDRLILGAGGDVSRTKNKGEDNVNSSLVYTSARWELSPASSVFLRLEQIDDELDEATRSARISFEVGF
jgi:hypothetical protein